jgi:hypothetical protein
MVTVGMTVVVNEVVTAVVMVTKVVVETENGFKKNVLIILGVHQQGF